MGAARGNQNARNHNGSMAGRKSAYQELADARDLHELFTRQLDRASLQAAFDSGKCSLQEALLTKAIMGSERILLSIFERLYPITRQELPPNSNGIRIYLPKQLD